MLKLSFAALLIVWWWVFVRWAGSTPFSALQSISTWTVTAQNWNDLLSSLDNLQKEVEDITFDIPAWTIIASTQPCAWNWERYSAADWRFIMWWTNPGTKSTFTDSDGQSTIHNWLWNKKIEISNLPAHSHGIALWWRGSNQWNWTDFVTQVGNSHAWVAGTYATTNWNTENVWGNTAINVANPYVILYICKKK